MLSAPGLPPDYNDHPYRTSYAGKIGKSLGVSQVDVMAARGEVVEGEGFGTFINPQMPGGCESSNMKRVGAWAAGPALPPEGAWSVGVTGSNWLGWPVFWLESAGSKHQTRFNPLVNR